MNAATFAEQVKAMSDRLGDLYDGMSTSSLPDESLTSAALKELGIASERLQIAAELMHRQKQELGASEQAIFAERQRYQELLDSVPDAYLTTTATGIIQEANSAAAELLHLQPFLLRGRPLSRFVTLKTQQHFQAQIDQLRCQPGRREWQIYLQTDQGSTIPVIVSVRASGNPANPTLRWLLRKTASPQPQAVEERSDDNLYAQRTLQRFDKGEIIPSAPEAVWQVCQGLVKLTTFSSSGEELLAGLAGASAPFGQSLIASPIYQAIALTDTQLWCFSLSEIATSSCLAQSLLPHIAQRLRQSEALIAIYGQQRVEDRLRDLLLLLKQEVGEPVEEGTRIAVRLTHEDLASACRTTRVTVTRTLGQFMQQQKISVDAKQHLIIRPNV